MTVGIPVDLPKVKASALTDQKDPIEITVNLKGEVYIGESLVEVDNLIPRINAITEQNTNARIYIRGDRGSSLRSSYGNYVYNKFCRLYKSCINYSKFKIINGKY